MTNNNFDSGNSADHDTPFSTTLDANNININININAVHPVFDAFSTVLVSSLQYLGNRYDEYNDNYSYIYGDCYIYATSPRILADVVDVNNGTFIDSTSIIDNIDSTSINSTSIGSSTANTLEMDFDIDFNITTPSVNITTPLGTITVPSISINNTTPSINNVNVNNINNNNNNTMPNTTNNTNANNTMPNITNTTPDTDTGRPIRDTAVQLAINATGGGDENWNPEGLRDGEILKQTLMFYGNFFVACLFLFCMLRKMFPRAYNLRSGWIDEDVVRPNPRATNRDAMGRISWLWKVWFVSDSELSDDCGMDALCLSRVLEWGARLSLVGSVVGCVMLMPVYATADPTTGGVEQLNTSNVPDGWEGRGRFVATVVAAYCIFGYAMHSMLQEFEWFYRFRYEFLSRPMPRNYTVYARNLTEEHWTSKALISYFSNFEDNGPTHNHRRDERVALLPAAAGTRNNAATRNNPNVTKAWVSLKIPKLKQLVAKRAAVLTELEHTINIEDVLHKIPMAKPKIISTILTIATGTTNTANAAETAETATNTAETATDSNTTLADSLFRELEELNKEITASIEAIDRRSKLDNPLEDYDASDYQNPVLVEGSEKGNDCDYDRNYTYDVESGGNYGRQHYANNKTGNRKTYDTFFDSKSVDRQKEGKQQPAAAFMTVPQTIGEEWDDAAYEEDTKNIDNGKNNNGKDNGNDDLTIASDSETEKTINRFNNYGDNDNDDYSDNNYKENKAHAKSNSNRNNKNKRPMIIFDHVGKVANAGINQVGKAANAGINQVGKAANAGINVVGTHVERAASLVPFLASRDDDGAPMTAGFVSFTSLKACQAAKQMIHSRDVFGMEIIEAPGADDILWKNVGKSHKELQIGLLLSISLTSALCFFWTIVIAFISTLSSVEGLTGLIPQLGVLLQTYPWLYTLLAQISPLMIVVANSLLKVILEVLSGFEGHVSDALIQASLFSKLSAFMIIQTFFVNAISGSLVAELSAIVQNPSAIVELLANSLPNRSSFFIQIMLVQTSVNLSMELLRVSPVAIAFARSVVGPKLTEEERRTTWMGLRPLADPLQFQHAEVLSGIVFYFIVFFVYATLAPITSIFVFICFVFMGAIYRHQFIFIYPTLPDSGGKLWVQFMQIVPVSLIIAEVTIVGFLALKTAPVASSLMVPLLIITILFNIYIRQKHYAVTNFLSGCACVDADRKNNIDGPMDMRFISNQYKQPELRDKVLYPSNASLERQVKHGILSQNTLEVREWH